MREIMVRDRALMLRTAHGTLLAVDPITGVLIHGSDPPPAATLLMQWVGGHAAVLRRRDGACFRLPYGAANEEPRPRAACLLEPVAEAASDEAATTRAPRVVVRVAETMLTALPRGAVSCDRREAGSWELFAPESAAGFAALDAIPPDAPGLEAMCLDPVTDPELAAALLACLPGPQRRPAVEVLARRPDWPDLFPSLRLVLSGGQVRSEWHTRAHLRHGIEAHGWTIGDHTYGAPEIVDGEHATLAIGRYCSIARDVRIVVSNHVVRSPTTYPFGTLGRFWPSSRNEEPDHTTEGVEIGNDVWIGAGATVLPGARLGDGVILGADAVIAGTARPYAVMVGNPAREVRRRFDEAVIDRLLRLRWWDLPDWQVDRLIATLLGTDIDVFLDAAEACRQAGTRPSLPFVR